jgi:hypothetical protein
LLDDVLFKLSGNASFIVFADADIEMPVKSLPLPVQSARTCGRSDRLGAPATEQVHQLAAIGSSFLRG